MTLRRIHNSIQTTHHNNAKHIQQPGLKKDSVYSYDDEEEPEHPKTFLGPEVKWGNRKIKEDVGRIMKNRSESKAQTAREGGRSIEVKGDTTGKFTALNSARNSRVEVKLPESNNNSEVKKPELFVPERKKLQFRKNKFAANTPNNSSIKNDPQRRSITSFNTRQNKPNLSPNKSIIDQFSKNNQEAHSRIVELKNNEIKINGLSGKRHSVNFRNTIHQASNLRKYENEQIRKETLMNNRLKFITIDNQREQQKIELAKRKYEKVVSVRSGFLKQKQTINKKKLQNYLNEMNKNHSKVMLVKSQQSTKRMSLSRFSQSKTMEASLVRQQSKTNNKEVYNKKIVELNKKKEMVRHTQTSLEQSRERILEMNRSRISSVRSIQNKKLIKNYFNVQKREKINQKLYQTLQRQISLINQRKLKAASQLQQYQSYLGLNKSKSKQIPLIPPKTGSKISSESPFNKNVNLHSKIDKVASTTFNSSNSKSFYLTNY